MTILIFKTFIILIAVCQHNPFHDYLIYRIELLDTFTKYLGRFALMTLLPIWLMLNQIMLYPTGIIGS